MAQDNIFTQKLGEPVANDNFSLTSADGNILLKDSQLIDKLARFDRERIPERVVHAKGWGAHGEFTVTNDVSRYTIAKVFNRVGKKTKVLARFSTVAGGRDSADTVRDPRGFAVKFYTEDGILDIVGNNTPVFFIRDPIKFPDFIHSQKKNPRTNLTDPNAQWDFLSLTPESINQVTVVFSDRGIPYGFRFMDGFGTDTFVWYNAKGNYNFVKYHFISQQGLKYLPAAEAEKIAGENPDFAGEDLRDAISKGNFPSWKLYVQIMSPKQAETYRFDPFDTTKTWYEEDFPLIEVGMMTLNRNPLNFFNEVEQAAFCPANMVPGIAPSQDKMLQGRLFAYRDTQRYRLGTNFQRVAVNAPTNEVFNYERDGDLARNPNDPVNYYPNSMQKVTFTRDAEAPPQEIYGEIKRHVVPIKDIDFVQAGDRYRAMDEGERTRLIDNICASLSQAEKRIQYRQTALFLKADPEYGKRIAEKLRLNIREVYKLSRMSQAEREYATR